MQFTGKALLYILSQQIEPVAVCDAAGAPFMTAYAAEIRSRELLQAGGFIGVGNKRRIRYLQAMSPRVCGGWLGGSRTTRREKADGTGKYYANGQVMGNLREHITAD